MNSKLVFLDIDGTLTPPGTNTPPESALRAIRQAQARGHRIFLCTGRNLGMLSPVLSYGFEGAVASAGGYVFAGSRVLFDCPMSRQQQALAMDLLGQEGVFRTIETRDHAYGDENLAGFLETAGPGSSELERWRRALAQDLDIRPMSQYDGAPIYKIVIMCTRMEQLLPARRALEAEFNFCIQDVPAHGCLNGELINRRFDKGRGVRTVAQAFGADLSDTIGFGDSMNDLEMIETVGISVCMANGSPLLKEKSSLVCPSVEEDGIARAFSQLGLI